MSASTPPERRTRRYHVDAARIIAALGLPEGTRVRHVLAACDPVGLTLIVEHDSFPPVPEGAESPHTWLNREVTRANDTGDVIEDRTWWAVFEP